MWVPFGAVSLPRRIKPDPLFRPGDRSCLELTQQAATWIEDAQLARRIMNFSIGYAYTVKQILRRERLFAEDLEGIIDADEVRQTITARGGASLLVVVCFCCCCCCGRGLG